ncbi:hypothetical protein SKAU_G00415010 [Synaphobranchus kaupii]|uniref:LINE-1 type transposase domain-containing protein 1 n=1 Tax=Synaphobranchus kaupii TaxID=118154 RepID=A0A9Q1I9J0_SYNKA|nr:hypothetical protein SKAU_G00415010 [Synaphobranchus kaupii]
MPSGKKIKLASTTPDVNLMDAITQALQKQQELLQTDRVDKIQAEGRDRKRVVNSCNAEQQKLLEKLAELEDRKCRNNVRLGRLAPNREGDDPIGFLQKMLPVWIPLLSKTPIEIDRAHRVFGTGTYHTMIFRVLRYQDCRAILQGARKARTGGPIQDNGRTLYFKADYSPFTLQKRKAFVGMQKELYAIGINKFMIYPATLHVRHNGNRLRMLKNSTENWVTQSKAPPGTS